MQSLSAGLMVALACFAAIGPLAIDMYLPGLPQLQADLGVSASAAQLTISGFMMGMALGNLLFGPVSDSTGRKRPLVVASVVFLAASVLCAVAPRIELLVGARFVQGVAGGCILVVSRAIIPDVVRGTAAARAFSALMALTGFMPALAPAFGGLLIPYIGWRGVFWVLAGVNVLQLLLALWLPESLPVERRTTGALRGLFPRIVQCLRRPAFVGYMLAGALGFGALFAYIAASPLIMQRQLGFTAREFAFTFAAISLLFPLSNWINMRLLRFARPRVLLMSSLLIDALLATLLIPISLTGPSVWLLPCAAGLAACSGFIGANATALAVEEIRDIGAGAGTGAMGFTQFLVAAVVAPLSGLGVNHALTMAVASLACSSVALLAVAVLTRGARTRR